MIDFNVVKDILTVAIRCGSMAGLAMAAAMALGEKVGWSRVNLPKIDGEFFLGGRLGPAGIYGAGLVIHSVTSIGLAAACLVAAMFLKAAHLGFSTVEWGLGWSAGLWIVFGLTVSPVVGLGWFGHKAGRWVWLELLATHLVYGLTLAFLVA